MASPPRSRNVLATLAHELRNPLAPIRNSLHLLRLAAGGNGGLEQVHDEVMQGEG